MTTTPASHLVNHVTLRGRVSAPPERRELPSGDVLVTFRLIVQRSAAARRRTRQSVDVIECAVWTKTLQRSVNRLAADDHVVVTGELRRRFVRGTGGVTSHVSVDLSSCAKAPVASSA